MRQFLEAETSEEEIGGTDDDEDEGSIEQSDHDSVSELEIFEEEEIGNDQVQNDGDYFIGRDSATKWNKKPLVSKFAKTKKVNLVKLLPGPTIAVRDIKTEYEAFEKIFTEGMINEIVACTNIHIEDIQSKYSRERDAKKTTRNEILAFIGLLFLSGVKKANHTNFLELWNADGSGIEIFRACMSYNRFLFLLSAIRFDSKATRAERKKTDKLAAVRSILNQFINNCKSSYCLGEYLTIDEMLLPFRGRCSFIQYIPNKPAKYGLKIFAVCDSKTFYVSNIELYCGKQPEGPYSVANSPNEIVMRLLDDLRGTRRNLSCDNWYTSYPLAMSLLDKNITLVGTLKKNKRELPPEFLPNKTRVVNSSLFGFQKNIMIASYVPKRNKAVVLLSTMHDDDAINSETQKPEVIHFYNSTKGGVDTVDQMTSHYSVSRRTNRWTLCFFFQLINIAGLNSQILYNSIHAENPVRRRLFLKSLALELMKNHLEERAQLASLPSDVKSILSKYRKRTREESEDNVEEPPLKIRSRCTICGRSKNRVTTMRCTFCKIFVCKEHSSTKVTCQNCLSQAGSESE